MAKDIIYIDVEDDITTIIGKIKASKEKIIALVPPKRVGILQSDVNLRLLEKNAKKDGKQIVLITNDSALVRLAGVAGIPVAKNLQSKPEIPEVSALLVDDDDVIDGSELSVGEHDDAMGNAKKGTKGAKAASSKKKSATSDDLDDLDLDDDAPNSKKTVAPSSVKRTKVPNFDSFRKKLFIGIGAGVAAIGLLVWMFVFAPSAIITVIAKTTDFPVSVNVALSNDQATSVENNILQSNTITLPEDNKFSQKSVEFTATGTKDIGEKAGGTMKVTRTSMTSSTPLVVPAGTGFSSGNYTFVSTQAVTLPGVTYGEDVVMVPSKTIPVVAVKIGEEFNLSARSYNPSIAGISASGSAMTGGSSKQLKIVTQADVNTASQQLGELSEADAKKALLASIPADQIAINDSYTVSKTDVVATPAIGAEAPDGKGTVTLKAVYTIKTVAKSELKAFITKKVDGEIENGKDAQKVYDYGVDGAKLTEFTVSGGKERVKITAIAKVGPKLEAEQIKEIARGKKAGEIREQLKEIDGVSEVEVKFSYFWVTRVPDNDNKIEVDFTLESTKNSNSSDKKDE